MEDTTLIFFAIVALLLILCCTIGLFLYLCGITRTVDVGAGSPPIGKVILAYKFARGPYYESGNLFTEALKFAPPNSLSMGIYYDDPQKIPKHKLRYAVGVILSQDGVKIEKEVEEKMVAEGFKTIELPKVAHCVRTDFPYVNVLSIFIAVWKVYPKLSQYVKEHSLCAYPMIEVYTADKIRFMAPLSQQEDFYVPEAKENIPEEYLEPGNESTLDYSLLSASGDSVDRSSRGSSLSTFSRSYVSSRFGDEHFSDEDSDANDQDLHDDEEIQDEEISSTVDVRPSKACTNLLEESEGQENVSFKEDGSMLTDEETAALAKDQKDTSATGDDSLNLQDSGICSGRTSASPTLNDSLPDTGKTPGDNDGEDSSSSFEEIKMENVEKEIASS